LVKNKDSAVALDKIEVLAQLDEVATRHRDGRRPSWVACDAARR
jgi:hypothetical protein